MDRTAELLGVVVEDGDVVEDAVVRRTELGAVDLVGEEGEELQIRGHEAVAAREPVLRQKPACHHRRDAAVESRRRAQSPERKVKGPLEPSWLRFVSTLN